MCSIFSMRKEHYRQKVEGRQRSKKSILCQTGSLGLQLPLVVLIDNQYKLLAVKEIVHFLHRLLQYKRQQAENCQDLRRYLAYQSRKRHSFHVSSNSFSFPFLARMAYCHCGALSATGHSTPTLLIPIL